MNNHEIATTLGEAADLLEQTGANPYRVRAYRAAVSTIRRLDRSVTTILAEEGTAGLERLENIGPRLASTISQLAADGEWPLLDRLRADLSPEQLFDTLPGVGPELARRIHEELGVSTLEELELAAADGRLERVSGIGPTKAAHIREAITARLRRRRPAAPVAEPPPISELLSVDEEYRTKAEAGQLHKIAPRRFNPTGEAWLPVLHTRRGDRRYTALFSNTGLAHELGKTHDWVVLYYSRSGEQEAQATVVTETHGDLAGLRVVRGREEETQQFYETERAFEL